MKNRLANTALAIFCLTCSVVQAQVDLNNVKNYGVWQWLSAPLSVKTFPEIRGRMYNAFWKDIEPSPNAWDWTLFDNEIKSRIADSLPFIFKVYTKEDAPMWLYSNGVPKVIERDNAGFQTGWAPYYMDPDYKFYFKRMVTAVRQHIESYPLSTRKFIIGVQACFGSTGDYISYKGNVASQYEISYTEFFELFKEFSLHYKAEYANTNPKIYVLSNPPNTGREQYEWVAANLPGQWLKCGTMGKGYQLNDERTKYSWLYPMINNPQPDGNYVRVRSEITHDGLLTPWWDKIPYQNMFSIMCYGIHWGLDWSNQGYNQFTDNLYDSAFFFFNRYAGQKNPLTATNAMCFLKDVIDASDAVRFPASTYGTVSRTAARFNSVLAPFIPYGAKLEDVSSAIADENVNVDATGINDVGWDLFPGNYERYLHQINANATSTGYWNVVSADPKSMYGRFARGFEISKGKTALYFDVDNGFLGNKALSGAYPVIIDIIYLDNGTGSWQLLYDANTNSNKVAYTLTCTNSRQWKKASITISDANFGNRATSSSDFFIRSASGNTQNVLFSFVELSRPAGGGSGIGLFSSDSPVFDTVCVNSTTAPQAFVVSGSYFTQSTVTVGPKAGFQFSTASDGVYTDSLVLTNIGASFSKPVYIRFNPKTAGSFSGGIPLKGGGVPATTIPVTANAVNSLPAITADVKQVACFNQKNGSINLTATGGIEPITYSWVNNTTNFKSTAQDISSLVPSMYTVTINAYKGCTVKYDYNITQPEVLTAAATYENMICKNTTTSLTITATGGTMPYTGTGTFTVGSGWKNYTVTDVNGCSDNVGITVPNGSLSVPAKPGTITGTTSDVTGVCANGTYEFKVAPVSGASSYAWTVPAGSSIASTSNGGATIQVNTSAAYTGGSISVKSGNQCGTSTYASSKTLSKTPAKPGTITGPKNVGRNQAGLVYSVPAVAGLTYTWTVPGVAKITAGQNTPSITVTWGTSGGNVTVKANNSCATSASTSLYVNLQGAAAPAITESSSVVVAPPVDDAFNVYPNPATAYANLSFGAAAGRRYSIVITDITGRKVIRRDGVAVAGINNLQVDVQQLSRGVYMVQLVQAGSPVQTIKLVKE